MYEIAVIIPVITGIVEVLKRTGLPSKLASITSLALGVAIIFYFGEGETADRIFVGILAGLSASGLYSSVKTQVKMV